MPRPRPRSVALLTAGAVAGIGLSACGGPTRSAGDFCGELAANQAALVAPIATPADIEATLALYRRLAEEAPLAIEEEWETLVVNLETADTVDPADPESVQRAANAAYATEEPAHAVAEWARTTCAVEIGPVGTVAPEPPPTSTTTPDDAG